MSTTRTPKLTKLLDAHLHGTVLLASWLEQMGISRDLQKRYRKSGWLESIGTGAFKRPAEQVTWQGALHSLQVQAKLPVHAGAMTALALQGYAHYSRLGGAPVDLFSPVKTLLPAWFKKYDWGVPIRHTRTSILPPDIGLGESNAGTFSIQVSSPERAMLELLHLAPEEADLVECFQVMEGLTTLRPKLVQQLLEKCTSVKVNRLFLFMADKARHAWLVRVSLDKVDLGTGHRRIVDGGVYDAKYQLTLPRELVEG